MSSTIALTAPNGRKIELPTGLFINNEWVKATKNGTITSIDPTNETEITSVQAATSEDVDTAVDAARTALEDPSWADMHPSARGELIRKLSDLVQENLEDLATLETWDGGKPYSVSLTEDLPEVVSCLRYFAGFADKIHGQVIDSGAAKFAYTIREPIGVCGQIIPWNYPLMMAAWKLGPALTCGNTVVLKPSELTPLSILYFADLIKKAGFPPGVVNILNGHGAEAGTAIANHPGIDKLAFTGSTATGQKIMAMAASNLKNITLETGGKSPLLVFNDADIDQTVKWAHAGIMSNQGQICSGTSRIIVQKGVYEQFIAAFKKYTAQTSKVGDPFRDDTFQGPQISKAQYDRVLSYIDSGVKQGARLVLGGAPSNTTGPGFFIQPTILADATEDMTVSREEIFGPVVVISPFETEAEAVKQANNSPYGLGCAIFTQNLERSHRLARKIESGTVWINSSNDSDSRTPFGGVKQSGIGRELGEAGLAAYSSIKAVHVNIGAKL
ncbi:mitochondrial aldehyde dehydrogenase [Aspergillus melleus]|uniref:mitochondrial aldehyde dehydrogenase n=1 Tax=Aspergillus melleus TaxID=138277 RepID=UPI001E8E55EE|nr:mitochondrial aldehyde dehydrogenase [Aspergillus melleus]KAH8424763.1 mitochondrial aldehyde dehydrogenase [Aspergillus melleus]